MKLINVIIVQIDPVRPDLEKDSQDHIVAVCRVCGSLIENIELRLGVLSPGVTYNCHRSSPLHSQVKYLPSPLSHPVYHSQQWIKHTMLQFTSHQSLGKVVTFMKRF